MEIKLLCFIFLLCVGCIKARPQDLGTGMMLAAAQLKDLVETGAAARNDQSVEILGQRMRGGMEFGFGDAMRQSGRRRRSILNSLQHVKFLAK